MTNFSEKEFEKEAEMNFLKKATVKDETIKDETKQFMNVFLTMDKFYEEYAKSVGLSYMSLYVLEIIYANPENCTQKLICEQSLYSKQSVNIIVKAFLETGCVKLKEDNLDRRNKFIILTEHGAKKAEKIIGRLWEITERALGALDPGQMKELLFLLGKCENAFEKEMRLLPKIKRKIK